MNVYLLFANTVKDYNYPDHYDPVIMDQIWDFQNRYNVYDMLEDPILENSLLILDRIYLHWIVDKPDIVEKIRNIKNKKILILHHYKCLSALGGIQALAIDKHTIIDQLNFAAKNVSYITQIKSDIPLVKSIFGNETLVTYFDKWLEELHRYQIKGAMIVKKHHLEKDKTIEQKKFSLFIRRYQENRLEVMMELISKNLLTDFHYTFAARGGNMPETDIGESISRYINNIPERYIHAHSKILEWAKGIPYEVEKIASNTGEGYETLFTQELGKFYNSSSINLVLETDFHNNHPARSDLSIITEKTYKAMFYKKPFILCSQPNTLQVLKDCGYKTFGHVIDESYDLIDDVPQRLDKISNELLRIRSLDDNSFRYLIDSCQENIEHNYNLMMSESLRKVPEEFNIRNIL